MTQDDFNLYEALQADVLDRAAAHLELAEAVSQEVTKYTDELPVTAIDIRSFIVQTPELWSNLEKGDILAHTISLVKDYFAKHGNLNKQPTGPTDREIVRQHFCPK